MADGGGGGGAGYTTGDGLIDPTKIPVIDTAKVTEAATDLRTMGTNVKTHVTDLNTEWKKLSGVYQAPEQETVYALQNPAQTAAESLQSKFSSAAGRLDTFASALAGIKTKFDEVRTGAEEFRTRALRGWQKPHVETVSTASTTTASGYNLSSQAPTYSMYGSGTQTKVTYTTEPWSTNEDLINENNQWLAKVADQVALVSDAESTCAKAINGLVDGMCISTPGPISAAQLRAATDLPWGHKTEYQPQGCMDSAVHGVGDGIGGMINGAGALIGYDSETGEWGHGEVAAQAWKGMGNLAIALVVTSMPGLNAYADIANATGHGNAVTQFVSDKQMLLATTVTSFVGIDLNAKDPFHKWKEDGVRTLFSSATNIGTFFIPGGDVGKVLELSGTAGKVAKVASIVADMIPGGSKALELTATFGKGGLKVLGFGEDAGKVGDVVKVADAAKVGDGVKVATTTTEVGAKSTGAVSDAAFHGGSTTATKVAADADHSVSVASAGHDATTTHPATSGSGDHPTTATNSAHANPEVGPHDPSVTDPAHPGTAVHDTTGHDTTGHDTTGHDTTGHDTTGHDTTGHDTTTNSHGQTADPHRPGYDTEGKPYVVDRGDGKVHYEKDPADTYRDTAGRLQHDHGGFVQRDPYSASGGITHFANPEVDLHQHVPSDGASASRWSDTTHSWDDARAASRDAAEQVPAALDEARSLGIDVDHSSRADVVAQLQDIADELPPGDPQAERIKGAVHDLSSATDLSTQLKIASEWSGDVAGRVHNDDLGRTTILGEPATTLDAAHATGAGKLDQVSINSEQNQLIVGENKGGDTPQLTSRGIADGTRAQQARRHMCPTSCRAPTPIRG